MNDGMNNAAGAHTAAIGREQQADIGGQTAGGVEAGMPAKQSLWAGVRSLRRSSMPF